MSIRTARPSDADEAVVLTYAVFQELGNIYTAKDAKEDILAMLAHLFRQEGNRLSYQNALVDVRDGKVTGIIIIYHGQDTAKLDQPLLAHIRKERNDPTFVFDKEAEEDEFYIDTLSVAPPYNGQGIGTTLIQAAEQIAKQQGYTKIALNVEPNNTKAIHLYQKLGYETVKQISIGKRPYYHQVKSLS